MLRRVSSLLTSLVLSSGLFANAMTVKDLSLEQKVGQLLMVYFNGEECNQDARRLIREAKVGSFIFYKWANGLERQAQVRELCEGLQGCAAGSELPPLLLAIDQEGGATSRLGAEFTSFPGAAAVGCTEDSAKALSLAEASGREMRACGINMNLAPVIDVRANTTVPGLALRCFSTVPKVVADFGSNSVAGYKSAGVIPCLKHFPGLGCAELDTHQSLPVISKLWERFKNEDLYPFSALLAKSPTVMSSHCILPELDTTTPVSLSRTAIQGTLREKMGFNGVVVTDSLRMGALKDSGRLDEVALAALLAGNDILLLGPGTAGSQKADEVNEAIAVHRKLCQAVRSGKIPMDTLDAAVQRVLDLKSSGTVDWSTYEAYLHQGAVPKNQHANLARDVATLATCLSSGEVDWGLESKNFLLVCSEDQASALDEAGLANLGRQTHILTYTAKVDTAELLEKAINLAQDVDRVVFISNHAFRNPGISEVGRELCAMRPTTVIVTGCEDDVALYPEARQTIITYGTHAGSLAQARSLLFAEYPSLAVGFQKAKLLSKQLASLQAGQSGLVNWAENDTSCRIGLARSDWAGEGSTFASFLRAAHLSTETTCPWTSREAFLTAKAANDASYQAALALATETLPYQVKALLHNLHTETVAYTATLDETAKAAFLRKFSALCTSGNGMSAALDYVQRFGFNRAPTSFCAVLGRMSLSEITCARDGLATFCDSARTAHREAAEHKTNPAPITATLDWIAGYELMANPAAAAI